MSLTLVLKILKVLQMCGSAGIWLVVETEESYVGESGDRRPRCNLSGKGPVRYNGVWNSAPKWYRGSTRQIH